MALSDNLLAYRKLDEASGTTASDSVGSNTGTASHSGILGSAGKINNGGTFNGTTNYITVGTAFTQTGTFSASCWVKADTTANSKIFVKSNDFGTAGRGFQILSVSGVFQTLVVTTNPSTIQYASPTSSYSVGVRYHVYGYYNATTQRVGLYVNGVFIGQTATGTVLRNNASNASIIGAGKRTGGYYEFFDGIIDEVGVRNRVLTESEIAEIYNGGAGNQYPFLPINTTNFFNFI